MAEYNVDLHSIANAIDSAKETLEALNLTGDNSTRRTSAVNSLDDLKTQLLAICSNETTSHIMHFVEP